MSSRGSGGNNGSTSVGVQRPGTGGGSSAGGGAGGSGGGGKICQFKLVLLGESAVGKSSLVLRFVKGQFHEYQESTIGGTSAPHHVSPEDCRKESK